MTLRERTLTFTCVGKIYFPLFPPNGTQFEMLPLMSTSWISQWRIEWEAATEYLGHQVKLYTHLDTTVGVLSQSSTHVQRLPLWNKCVYPTTLTFLCWQASSSQLSFLTRRGIEPLGQLIPFFGWLLLLLTVGVDALTSSGIWGGAGATLCLPEPNPWATGLAQASRMLALEEEFLDIMPVKVCTNCIKIRPRHKAGVFYTPICK